ncbi:MAG: hypothetical protein Q8R36_00005 [bacterium]|nr:hypothetical protein [bacterium]
MEKSKKFEAGIFVANSKGEVWEGNVEDPGDMVVKRDRLDEEVLSKTAKGQKEKDEFIINALKKWPIKALQTLVQAKPGDALAQIALQKKPAYDALREKLIDLGKKKK